MPNGESFRQKVIYEVNPCYSTKCKSNEHFLDDCTINKPWIKKKGKKAKTTLNNQEVATVTTEPSQYTDHVPSDTSTPCTDVAVGDFACIGSEDAIPLEDKKATARDNGATGGIRIENRFVPLLVKDKSVACGGSRWQPTSGVN
nr:hypothetical protein Itr_chr03CG00340 [Ipomoea trifida]